jgi:PD-(D/E)XK nuclease superfamily
MVNHLPRIERVDGLPFGRCYKVYAPDKVHHLPSVTTVLKMNPKPEYDAMKEDMGEDKYKSMLIRKAERGTVMHRWLEVFLGELQKGKVPSEALALTQLYISTCTDFDGFESDVDKAMKIGRNLFYNFYQARFWEDVCDIDQVLHNELFMFTLFRGKGWAGATDFVYRSKEGKIVIADFKSSSSMKDECKIDDYKMQISTYMFKYGEMYGEIPDRGEILVANEFNDQVQRIVVPYRSDTTEDSKFWLKRFLGCMDMFRETPEWIEYEKTIA